MSVTAQPTTTSLRLLQHAWYYVERWCKLAIEIITLTRTITTQG